MRYLILLLLALPVSANTRHYQRQASGFGNNTGLYSYDYESGEHTIVEPDGMGGFYTHTYEGFNADNKGFSYEPSFDFDEQGYN